MVIFMCRTEFEELKQLDRDALTETLASELPMISGAMGMRPSEIAWRTGLNKDRLSLILSGKRKMKWSEYMSILFFLWDDEKGREVVEKYGLFPDVLKNAMTVERGFHKG